LDLLQRQRIFAGFSQKNVVLVKMVFAAGNGRGLLQSGMGTACFGTAYICPASAGYWGNMDVQPQGWTNENTGPAVRGYRRVLFFCLSGAFLWFFAILNG
jgi:hypothetical protein